MPNITNFPKGKVGIGTENPTETLDVRGTLRVTGSTGTGTTLLGRDGNGNVSNMSIGNGLGITNGQLFATGGASGTTGGSGSTSQVAYWIGSTTLSGENNLWWDSGNDRLGIGTNNPQQSLHVAGSLRLTGSNGTANSIMGRDANFDVSSISVGTGLSLSGGTLSATGTSGGGGITSLNSLTGSTQTFSTGNTGTDFNISSVGTTHTFNIPTASSANRGLLSSTDWSIFNSKVGGSGTSTRIAFWSGSATISSSSNLYWDNNTNSIGIGTSSPTSKLQVVGDALITQGAVIQGSGTTSAAFAARFQNSGSTDILVVRNDNRVGINTSSPNQTLEVAGTMRLTGSTGTGTTLMARNASFDVSAITVGTGLSLSGNTLTTTGNTTGTGAAGRVTIWSSATELTNDNNLLWDFDEDRLGIGVVPLVPLHVQSPSNATIRLVRTTTSPADFSFIASNSKLSITGGQTFAISTTGLGLGTDTPAQTLHVAGTMRLTGSTGTSTSIMGRDANGDISTVTIGSGLLLSGNQLTATGGGGGGTITGSGTATQVAFWNGTTSLTGSTNLYWDNGNNRLGIGTSLPSNQLTTTQDILIATNVTAGKGGNNIPDNTAFGVNALSQNAASLASGNTAFGFNTLTGNTFGGSNTAMGAFALQRLGSGSSNVGVGVSALSSASIVTNSTAIGVNALGAITTGSTNIAIGRLAGYYFSDGVSLVTSANNSIFIGGGSRASNASPSNQIVIGTNLISLGDNTTTIGTTGTTQSHLYGNLTLGLTTADATTRLKTNSSTGGNDSFAAKFQNNIGTDIMVVRGDGKVGIGTNSPSKQLTTTEDILISTNIAAGKGGNNIGDNTAFGVNTLSQNAATNASGNTAFGFNTLTGNTIGGSNTAIGKSVLRSLSTGGGNTVVGALALDNAQTTIDDNVVIGREALNSALSDIEANVAIGSESLIFITTGSSQNIAIGSASGAFFGSEFDSYITSANNSIFIGALSRGSNASPSNQIVIGTDTVALGNNTTTIGGIGTTQTHLYGNLTLGSTSADNATRLKVTGSGITSDTFTAKFQNSGSTDILVIRNDGNVGIGTNAPAQTLHVAGTFRLTGSTGTGTTLMARDENFDVSAITVGSGLSLSGNTLTATGSSGGGTLTGSGTATQVAFWSGATGTTSTALTSSSGLTWDNTNGYLGIRTSNPTSVLDVRSVADGPTIGTTELSSSYTSTGWTGSSLTWTHTTGNTGALTASVIDNSSGMYRLVMTITGRTTGTVNVTMKGSITYTEIGANGTTYLYFSHVTTNGLTVTPTSNFNGTITFQVNAINNSTPVFSTESTSGTTVYEQRTNNSNTNLFQGVESGRVNITTQNIAQGYQAAFSNINGVDWLAQGYQTGFSNINGINWIAQGSQAGYSNTTGRNWIAQGYRAGYSNTTGWNWMAQGYQAGYSNTTGWNWMAQGYQAGYSNTTGWNWIAQGYRAGYSNQTGANWVAQGYQAGYFNTSGSSWFASGYEAGLNNQSGSTWVAVGFQAATFTPTLTAAQNFENSVYIGAQTRATSGEITTTNETVIGYQAVGLGTNTSVLGNTGTTQTHLHGSLTLGLTTSDSTTRLKANSSTIDSSSFAAKFQDSSGTNILVVRGDDRVGIGTSSPNASLQIDGLGASTGTSSLLIRNSDGTNELFRVRDDGMVVVGANTSVTTQNSAQISVYSSNATGSTNVVISPKANGAFIVGPAPDGTNIGGNARGIQSVDFQRNRITASTRVASGDYCVLLNGSNNQAGTSSYNFVGNGTSNIANGGLSFIGNGDSNNAGGNMAVIVGGGNNTASNTQTFVGGGVANTASAIYSSVVGGRGNEAIADYSNVSGGFTASAYLYGMSANSSGSFTSAGAKSQAQRSVINMRRAITGTGTSDLFLDGSSSAAILGILTDTPIARLWNVNIQIAAICVTSGGTVNVGDSYSSNFTTAIKRIGTSTSLVGTVQQIGTTNSDTSMSSSVVTITANDSNEALRVQFTSPTTSSATTALRVVATLYLTEVGF